MPVIISGICFNLLMDWRFRYTHVNANKVSYVWIEYCIKPSLVLFQLKFLCFLQIVEILEGSYVGCGREALASDTDSSGLDHLCIMMIQK